MADTYFQLSQSGQQVQNLLNDVPNKAPLASPALTGNPTAPTQAISDSSTKIATTQFVDDYVTDYNSNTVTPAIAAKQNTAVTATGTLAAASWVGGAQTITVTGVTATNIVFVAPTPASQIAFAEAQIICTAQAANALTFSCQSTPAVDLTINAVIL